MRQQFSRYNGRKARERRFGSSYHADAVHFDGGEIYLSIASLTAASSGDFSSSMWIRTATDQSGGKIVWAVDPENTYRNNAGFQNANQLTTAVQAGDGASDFGVRSNAAWLNNAWHHILVSLNANAAAEARPFKIFVDDVDVSEIAADTGVAFTIPFNALPFFFGDDSFGSGATFDVADTWIAPGQSLLTAGDITEATRRKFISATGKPVDLGADGSTPTGTAPAIFFSGDATGFATNKGTGGAFTLTGLLTNANTSPSD